MRKLFIYLIICAGLFSPFSVLGATFFTDDFNSYTDGPLNGQGGWFGSDAFIIQSEETKEGAKAIIVQSAPLVSIGKTGATLDTGKITNYFYKTHFNADLAIYLCEGGCTPGTEKVWVRIPAWDKVLYYSGGFVELGTYSLNEWFYVQQEWKYEEGYPLVRFNLNGNGWTDWTIPYQSFTTLSGVRLTGAGYDWPERDYFDYIAEEPYEEPPPPPEGPKIISFEKEDATNIIDYSSNLISDLASLITLIIGLPLGFWIIKKAIGLT